MPVTNAPKIAVQHRHAVTAQLLKRAPEFLPRPRVQAGGGLVEEDYPRPAGQARRRTASGSATTSWPSTLARPAVGRSRVARTRTSVVLPAPLGPSRPKTVPGSTSRSSPSGATTSPQLRRRSWGGSRECSSRLVAGSRLGHSGGAGIVGQLAGRAQRVTAGAPLDTEGRHPLDQKVRERSLFQQARPAGRWRVAQRLEPVAGQGTKRGVLHRRIQTLQPELRVQADQIWVQDLGDSGRKSRPSKPAILHRPR